MNDIFQIIYFNKVIWFLFLQFFAFLLLLFLNFKNIKKEFSGIYKISWFTIFLISMWGLLFIFISRWALGGGTWFDLIVAKEFLIGKIDYYVTEYYYGPFYPFLTSLMFLLFGINPILMDLLNLFFLFLLPFIVFLISYTSFKNEKIGIIAALISVMIFHNGLIMRIHFGFVYPTLFFIGLALLFSLLSYKINNKKMYFLALITFLLAGQIKIEHMIILVSFFIGIFLFKRGVFTSFKEFRWFFRQKLLIPFFLFLILSGTYFVKYQHITNVWLCSRIGILDLFKNLWNKDFSNLSVDMLVHGQLCAFGINHLRISSKGFFYFWTSSINKYLSLFFIIAILFSWKKYGKETIFLITTFLLHNIPYLLHYNGYQSAYGMLTYVPYIIVTGFGIYRLIKFLKMSVNNLLLRIKSSYKISENFMVFVFLIIFLLIFYTPILKAMMPFKFKFVPNFYINECENRIADKIDDSNSAFVLISEYGEEHKWKFLTLQDVRSFQRTIQESNTYRRNIKEVIDQYPDIFSAPKHFYEKTYFEELEHKEKEILDKTIQNFYDMNKNQGIKNPLNITFSDKENYYIEIKPCEDMSCKFVKDMYKIKLIYECNEFILYKLST